MKDYEMPDYDNKPINFHLIVIIGIAFLIFIIMFYPMFNNHSQKNIENKTNVSNISTITIYKEIYITVTPTPDGKIYFASEYESGIRKIKRPFSWYRADVTGLKDMSVHVVIYDYRIFDTYHWFNPQDYKYYEEKATKGNKFLFVFINIYMDDVIGKDTRMWLPDANHFGVQIDNSLYMPIEFEKQLRIKELEDVYNYNDDSRVNYYGGFRTYEKGNSDTAGEIYQNLTYLKGGKSNAIDGYIVYEIPNNIQDEQLIVSGNFYEFGNSAWVLKPQINENDYKPY